jgi:hypothetical protein
MCIIASAAQFLPAPLPAWKSKEPRWSKNSFHGKGGKNDMIHTLTAGFALQANDRLKIRHCKEKEAGRQSASGLRA